ncbi:MAG: hypothetical protein AB1560_11585 [Pseudomonadota bacterium]
MSEPIQIVIPPTAFVSCPIRKFAQVHAQKCTQCEFFRGLIETQNGTEFEEKFFVRCAAPMTRRINKIEIA